MKIRCANGLRLSIHAVTCGFQKYSFKYIAQERYYNCLFSRRGILRLNGILRTCRGKPLHFRSPCIRQSAGYSCAAITTCSCQIRSKWRIWFSQEYLTGINLSNQPQNAIAYHNSAELIMRDGNVTAIIFAWSLKSQELEVPSSLVHSRYSATKVIRNFDEYNVLFDVTRVRIAYAKRINRDGGINCACGCVHNSTFMMM